MRGILPLVFAIGWASNSVASECPQKPRSSCWDGTTQRALNECAAGDLRESDKELNNIYQELLEKHKSDSMFVNDLKTAQRAWVAYRDAHLRSRYPADDKRASGSARPMCEALILKRLTEERINLLKEMNDPVEGDVCNPSKGCGRS